MKHLLIIALAFSLTLVACNKQEKVEETIKKVTLAELNSGSFEYTGGEVEVEGLCLHVCSHSGKKMFIGNDSSEDKLQIFTAEGLASFPKELEGSKVVVIGALEEEKLDLEYANKLESELTQEEAGVAEHSCEFEDNMKKIKDLKTKIEQSKKGYISKFTMTSKNFKKI